jgi:hypothetical protein
MLGAKAFTAGLLSDTAPESDQLGVRKTLTNAQGVTLDAQQETDIEAAPIAPVGSGLSGSVDLHTDDISDSDPDTPECAQLGCAGPVAQQYK